MKKAVFRKVNYILTAINVLLVVLLPIVASAFTWEAMKEVPEGVVVTGGRKDIALVLVLIVIPLSLICSVGGMAVTQAILLIMGICKKKRNPHLDYGRVTTVNTVMLILVAAACIIGAGMLLALMLL